MLHSILMCDGEISPDGSPDPAFPTRGAIVRLTRALSILLLSAQLGWVAAPVLCVMEPATRCHESSPAPHHDPATPGMPGPASCNMPLACGITTPAVLDGGLAVSFTSPLLRVQAPDSARLTAVDPLPPLPPPPQA